MLMVLSAISFITAALVLEGIERGSASAFMSGGLAGMAIWSVSQ